MSEHFEYRIATPHDLEILWNKNIANNPDDIRWRHWKDEYIAYNEKNMAKTFAVICEEVPVGEGTLIFSPECKAVSCRPQLADGNLAANINALRIEKEYEGKGHISKLVKLMENYACEHGFEKVTIGVEAAQTRNLGIYLHFGYNEFVMSEEDGGELVLYYAKKLKGFDKP